MEKKAAYVGLILLLLAFLLLVISINRGKKIVAYLKQRYPQKWEDLGNPTPGYLNSSERRQWSKFIQQQEYLDLNDSKLKEMGDAQRNLELVTIGFIIAFAVGFGGIALWFKFAG